MVLAAIVGLGAGLAAVGPSVLVELSDRFFFDVVQDDWLPGARLILISVIGGLLVGPITHFLAAAGAAGGVAGIFNAPIAGVFFALEVLLRRFGTRNFSVIVLSSVVATVTAIRLRGDEFAIPVVTHHGLNSAAEAPLFVVLGVLCGLCGVAFIRIFYWTEDGFARLTRVPGWLLPAIGGAPVGGLALFNGSILGLRGRFAGADHLHPHPRGDDRRLRPDGAAADRHHGRHPRLAVAEPGHDLFGQGRTSRRRGRR